MLVVSLAGNDFLLPCFSGEGKTVASVRGQCEISSLNNFPTWEAKSFMSQFCCHPQHVVQCVLRHPRNKGRGLMREKLIVRQEKVKAKESVMATF